MAQHLQDKTLRLAPGYNQFPEAIVLGFNSDFRAIAGEGKYMSFLLPPLNGDPMVVVNSYSNNQRNWNAIYDPTLSRMGVTLKDFCMVDPAGHQNGTLGVRIEDQSDHMDWENVAFESLTTAFAIDPGIARHSVRESKFYNLTVAKCGTRANQGDDPAFLLEMADNNGANTDGINHITFRDLELTYCHGSGIIANRNDNGPPPNGTVERSRRIRFWNTMLHGRGFQAEQTDPNDTGDHVLRLIGDIYDVVVEGKANGSGTGFSCVSFEAAPNTGKRPSDVIVRISGANSNGSIIRYPTGMTFVEKLLWGPFTTEDVY